jgi:hypothetical protein
VCSHVGLELPQESALRYLRVWFDELRRRQTLKWLKVGVARNMTIVTTEKGGGHRSGIFSCFLGIRHKDEGRLFLRYAGVNLRIYTVSKPGRLSYEMLVSACFDAVRSFLMLSSVLFIASL